MKLAIALLTKDRVEQTRQSIKPLSQPAIDLWWVDGSASPEGLAFVNSHRVSRPSRIYYDIKGGADAAIVFAITEMLKHDYTHIGLCEQDVLLDYDWLDPTMALFERGRADGLEVGAVSARSYQDRILVQRDGYALMHNLGAGMVIWTREAAEVILQNYRNPFSTENRAIFNTLCRVELAKYWCFRGGSHFLTADWGFDATLARHGLASLALTPSAATMLEDIAPMGLQYANGAFDLMRNQQVFDRFASKTKAIRNGLVKMGQDALYFDPDSGDTTVFPHQIPLLGGFYTSSWRLKWCQGFGPFAYKAGATPDTGLPPALSVPIAGPADIMVSGGENGGQVHVVDRLSGYDISPVLMPDAQCNGQIMSIAVPGTQYRDVLLRMTTPGTVFHGIRVRSPQPRKTGVKFDWHCLPEVGE